MYPFDYRRAGSVAEAAAAVRADEGAKLLAGGQSLLAAMKQRLAMHSALIDIGRLPELKGIRREGERLVVGAGEKHADVAASGLVAATIPALGTVDIITAVSFAIPSAAAYVKFPNPASRYAMAGAFVARHGTGVRVAITGAASCVFRAKDLEAALTRDFRPEAIAGIALDDADMISDMHGSAAYRAQLAGVVARRAVARCLR